MGPFAAAFGFATVQEIRRYSRDGPVQDWRETFEFDEDAPTYEEPEEIGTEKTGTGETAPAQGA